MTAKFLTAAFLAVALGCAGSAAPSPPAVATSRAPLRSDRTRKVLRPVGVAQSMQAIGQTETVIVHRTKEGGVGLHGDEGTYIERVDPSGWSGRSSTDDEPPTAVGGGPAPDDAPATAPTTTDDNPYAE